MGSMIIALAALLMAGGTDLIADASSVVASDAENDLVDDRQAAMAADSQGRVVAVWQARSRLCDRPLFATSDDGGVSWSRNELLATTLTAWMQGNNNKTPGIAHGGGTWVVVWPSIDTPGRAPDSEWDILAARSTDHGATWSTPVAIGLPTSVLSMDVGPSIATDGQGVWIAVWEGWQGLPLIAAARSLDDGISWETPVTIVLSEGVQATHTNPVVAVDDSGNWVVAWDSSSTPGTGRDLLYVRSDDAGVTWSNVETLNTDAGVPFGQNDREVALATHGDAIVVAWTRTQSFESDVYYARSSDGGISWSDPAALNTDFDTDDESDVEPTIAVDDNGVWLAAWRRFNTVPNQRAAISRDGGATWSDPIVVPLDTGHPTYPDFRPILGTYSEGNWLLARSSWDDIAGSINADRDLLTSRMRVLFDATCGSDADLDGHGTAGDVTCPLGGATDCDDLDPRVAPGAVQSCDGINNDCGHASWPDLTATNEADDDGDGLSECSGDCNDAAPLSWSTPGPIDSLRIGRAGLDVVLYWDPPTAAGSDPSQLVYDVLRSATPFACSFALQQTCVETDDGNDLLAVDSASPQPGEVLFFQVRAENGCSGSGRLLDPERLAVSCEP